MGGFVFSPTDKYVQMLDAFRKFGIQDSTTNLLVIKVPVPSTNSSARSVEPSITTTTTPSIPSQENIEKHLQTSVQGISLHFDDETLASFCDVPKVKKAYKIALPPTATKMKRGEGDLNGGVQDDKSEWKVLERAILGAMALRGAT
jgi:EKC/KEOPS complex subunit CGI121/TPRKB